MQSRLLLQALFILSSLILAKAQDAMGLGCSCLRWKLDSDGRTRVTFLREEEKATGARSVYLSLWSDDLRPVSCEINSDPVVTERYRALCDGTRGPKNAHRFNISALLAPGGPCPGAISHAPKFTKRARSRGTTGKRRRKRAWILPGTLWCGRGSEAIRYEQLGMFENTDRCCREHDHCLHIIPPFRMNYGVFNPNLYTVSHCDCDQRFRECLLSVNDTISSMVGYSFFNILRVPCFELQQKRRCTKMYWWGMCKVAKEAPYAVFKPSLPYNTSDAIGTVPSRNTTDKSTSVGQHVTERPLTSPHKRSAKSQRRCGSRDPPRGDTFRHRRTKGKACEKQPAVTPSRMPTIPRSQSNTPSVEMGVRNVSKNKALTKKKRVGNNKKRVYLARSQRVTNSYPQPFSTASPSTTITAATKTSKLKKTVTEHSGCCRSRKPLRDETLRPHTTSRNATVTPAATMSSLHVSVTTRKKLRNTTASVARNRTTASFPRENDKPQKQVDFYLAQDNISQGPMGINSAQSSHVERSLQPNHSLRNVTDNHCVCESLKHLDECKYKIPPMEKKYDLQNMESKTTYHCDCTSRLAVQLESFNQLSVLPTLLKNYISQFCFHLPKETKCLSGKRCSGGFIVASDLFQTLKKTDTSQGKNSGNYKKRGSPVRLYKRCLRLKKELVHINIG